MKRPGFFYAHEHIWGNKALFAVPLPLGHFSLKSLLKGMSHAGVGKETTLVKRYWSVPSCGRFMKGKDRQPVVFIDQPYGVAISLLAAIGDITRFKDGDSDSTYFGQTPSPR